MIIGICALPSSLLAGILWENVNMFAPLYLSLALTAISTVMLFFLKEKNKGNNNGK
jgi:hypothetical protein